MHGNALWNLRQNYFLTPFWKHWLEWRNQWKSKALDDKLGRMTRMMLFRIYCDGMAKLVCTQFDKTHYDKDKSPKNKK